MQGANCKIIYLAGYPVDQLELVNQFAGYPVDQLELVNQ
jgi:hypothetical protein